MTEGNGNFENNSYEEKPAGNSNESPAPVYYQTEIVPQKSDRDWLTTLLLCFFLGALGVHRFYVGKIGTGIAIILTCGGFFGIWPLVDLIMIICGRFTDENGRLILNN